MRVRKKVRKEVTHPDAQQRKSEHPLRSVDACIIPLHMSIYGEMAKESCPVQPAVAYDDLEITEQGDVSRFASNMDDKTLPRLQWPDAMFTS